MNKKFDFPMFERPKGESKILGAIDTTMKKRAIEEKHLQLRQFSRS